VRDHAAAILCSILGFASGAYLFYGWRKGEIRARGMSRRSDGPLEWWSAILVVAILALAAFMRGVLGLTR
jgi:hypothetical protein